MSAPIVIIGAGPAGLSCAGDLAKAGRQVVIIDDNPSAGGQYFRQLPTGFQAAPGSRLLRDKLRYDRLAQVLSLPNVRHLPSTVAWGMPASGVVAYAGPAGSGRIQASAVVIACGAQERSLPFPGWTLPGVISAGGCLNLAKAHGLVPTGRVVIAGNGPLVLVAAATMITAGANVTTIVEAQEDRKLIPSAIAGLFAAPGILATAIGYRARMWRSGASFKTGWMVAEARGKDHLHEVAIAPIGAGGRPIAEKQRWIEADTLVLGYGLMPGSETARVIGCKMELRPDLNGVVPVRSAGLETTVPGVYAIGDGAGIGGAEIGLLEGAIAASSILRHARPTGVASRYDRLDRYRRNLNRAYMRPAPLAAATPETIVCRCEELTLERLSADPNAQRGHLNALKVSSRLGMGRCQGRNCLHTASALLELGEDLQQSHPRARPPLRPVPLNQLAADVDAGHAREPDEVNASENKEHQHP